MTYADECYEKIMGFPRALPAAERTPAERRVSLERFFAIMEAMTDEELAENPLKGRPLNTSILDDEDERSSDSSAA